MCVETGEPQRQHRHEALPTGEHLGVVAVLGEQRGDVGRATRARGTRTVRASSAAPATGDGWERRTYREGRGAALAAVRRTGRRPVLSARWDPMRRRRAAAGDPRRDRRAAPRRAPTGVETLMLRRNSKLAFAGGAWVFPGGRIDPEDYPGRRASPTTPTRCYRGGPQRGGARSDGGSRARRRPRGTRLVRALDAAARSARTALRDVVLRRRVRPRARSTSTTARSTSTSGSGPPTRSGATRRGRDPASSRRRG